MVRYIGGWGYSSGFLQKKWWLDPAKPKDICNKDVLIREMDGKPLDSLDLLGALILEKTKLEIHGAPIGAQNWSIVSNQDGGPTGPI